MEIVRNEKTGDEMKIYRSSITDGGDVFELDVTLHPHCRWSKGIHYHPKATETFKVVRGTLNMIVEDKEIVLTPDSREVIVPPNMNHCFWNDTDEYITFHSVISPVGNIEKGIRATYALANAGRTNDMNLPKNIFELAILGEILDSYFPKVPWQFQKALLKLIAGLGTLLGYRKRFDRYVNDHSKVNFQSVSNGHYEN